MSKYFTHNGIKEEGPFTLEELSLKGIRADTPIWYDGLTNWTVASLIPELKPLLEPKKTPPPLKPRTENTPKPPPRASSKPSPKPSPEPEEKQTKGSMKTYLIVLGVAVAFFAYTITKTDDGSLPAMHQEETPIDSTEVEEPRTEEEEKAQALENDKMVLRNDWARQISAKPDEYEIDELGGISELEVIVTNNMEYPLDEVKVAVKYIKENGGVFKTEYVKIQDIPANGKLSMPAPDSHRGTSVKLDIVAAHSKKLEFCYNADNDFRGSEDPYHCK
jgi:hypothetical protein